MCNLEESNGRDKLTPLTISCFLEGSMSLLEFISHWESFAILSSSKMANNSISLINHYFASIS